MPAEVRKAQVMGSKMANKAETAFLAKLEEEKIQFSSELGTLKQSFEWLRRLKDYKTWINYEEDNGKINENIKRAVQTREMINKREKLFNIDISAFDNLSELEERNEPFREMRDVSFEFERSKELWKDGALVKVKYPKVDNSI